MNLFASSMNAWSLGHLSALLCISGRFVVHIFEKRLTSHNANKLVIIVMLSEALGKRHNFMPMKQMTLEKAVDLVVVWDMAIALLQMVESVTTSVLHF